MNRCYLVLVQEPFGVTDFFKLRSQLLHCENLWRRWWCDANEERWPARGGEADNHASEYAHTPFDSWETFEEVKIKHSPIFENLFQIEIESKQNQVKLMLALWHTSGWSRICCSMASFRARLGMRVCTCNSSFPGKKGRDPCGDDEAVGGGDISLLGYDGDRRGEIKWAATFFGVVDGSGRVSPACRMLERLFILNCHWIPCPFCEGFGITAFKSNTLAKRKARQLLNIHICIYTYNQLGFNATSKTEGGKIKSVTKG